MRFSVGTCLCIACVRVFAYVCTSLWWVRKRYLCVCVNLCAWHKHDNIRVALEISQLKQEILFLTCMMWSMIVIFVNWPLFESKCLSIKNYSTESGFLLGINLLLESYSISTFGQIRATSAVRFFLGHPVYAMRIWTITKLMGKRDSYVRHVLEASGDRLWW